MTPLEPDNEPEDDDFFTDDPDDPEMLRSAPIPTVEWALADGAISFRLPEAWEITARDFGSATFDIAGEEGGEILFVADSFENPEAIAADDLRRYLEFPAGTPLPEDEFAEISAEVRTADGGIDWRKITLRREGIRNDPETGRPWAEAVIWRRICVLPPSHIRMLTVTLSLPLREDDDENARRARQELLEALIHHFVDAAQFSATPTRADRIAETDELVPHWFDDIVALRLPPGWQRITNPDKENGLPLYSYDAPENDEWTFWVQAMRFRVKDGNPGRAADRIVKFLDGFASDIKRKRNIEEFAQYWDPDDPLTGYIRHVSHETDSKDGVKLRRTTWIIVKGAPTMIVTLVLHWVVVDDFVDQPHIRALTDLLETEVPNALILPDLAAALFG